MEQELDLINDLIESTDYSKTNDDTNDYINVNQNNSELLFSSDDYNSFINDSEGFTSFISSGYGTRPNSTVVDPNEIINSLHLDMPELAPILLSASSSPQKQQGRRSLPLRRQAPPPKMTDLGFKMSKMIMSTTTSKKLADEEEDYRQQYAYASEDNVNSGDTLVDNYGQTRKRQKTGKRGRPKGTSKIGTQFGRASSTHALPANVAVLMGQANVAYVQKQYSKAIELYLQVVQRAPASPEPYYSLGLVYEEQGNADKAASYFLIAAHMQPRADGELWRRISALLVQVLPPRKDQAVYCLSRAIKAAKPVDSRIHDDFPLYWLRAKLQLEIGEYRSAITGFASALRLHLTEEAEDLSPFVLVARLAVRMSLSYLAVGVFESVFRSAVAEASLALSWSHLNILVELAEVDKDYTSIISSIEEFSVACYLQSGREQGKTDWMLKSLHEQFEKALHSDDMPVELKLKYAISQIHLKRSNNINSDGLLALLSQVDPTGGSLTNLKRSVADALIALNAPLPALKLLLELIDEDSTMATPETCLKIGQCYRKAGELEMAVESFLAVLHVDPDHRESRLGLSEAYRSLGKIEQALQVLPPTESQIITEKEEFINWTGLNDLFVKAIGVGIDLEYDDNEVDSEVDVMDEDDEIYESPASMTTTTNKSSRQRLRFGPERQRRSKQPISHEISSSQKAALRQNYEKLMNRNDLSAGGELLQAFSDTSIFFGESNHYSSSSKNITVHGLDREEWSRGLLKVISLQAADCVKRNVSSTEWDRLIRILRTIISSNLRENSIHWRVLGLLLAERAKRWDFVLENIKFLIANGSERAFLLPGKFMHKSSEFLMAFYHPVAFRFLCRLNVRVGQSNPALLVLLGHQSLATHNFEEATRLYFAAGKLVPQWRFLKLCIGNALLGRSSQRTCSNQLARLMQALVYFLEYHREGSGNDSQDDFNLARVFHQIGMMDKAVEFYTRSINNSQIHHQSSNNSVEKLAKYNLSRLYLQCGSPGMARLVLKNKTGNHASINSM